jgi:hypothetical protein
MKTKLFSHCIPKRYIVFLFKATIKLPKLFLFVSVDKTEALHKQSSMQIAASSLAVTQQVFPAVLTLTLITVTQIVDALHR